MITIPFSPHNVRVWVEPLRIRILAGDGNTYTLGTARYGHTDDTITIVADIDESCEIQRCWIVDALGKDQGDFKLQHGQRFVIAGQQITVTIKIARP